MFLKRKKKKKIKKKSKLAKLKAKIKEKQIKNIQMKQLTSGVNPEDNEDISVEDDDKSADNDDDDNFLTLKKKQDRTSETMEVPLVVSKNQLKKVNIEGGLFNGRNKTYFTKDGETLTHDEMKMKKIKEENAKIIAADEAPIYGYIEKIERNKKSDILRERERIKEKRIKKKLKIAAEEAKKHGNNSAVTLTGMDFEGAQDNYSEEEDGDVSE
jgi:hypothetical protein